MPRANPPLPIGPLSLPKRGRARVRKRHIAGEMNATEEKYAGMLDAQQMAGVIAHYWFEAITLRLAHDTRLTLDFMVQLPDGTIRLIDVKGWKTEDDAAVKLRVAATMFPFEIIEARYDKLKGWEEKTIGPSPSTPEAAQ